MVLFIVLLAACCILIFTIGIGVPSLQILFAQLLGQPLRMVKFDLFGLNLLSPISVHSQAHILFSLLHLVGGWFLYWRIPLITRNVNFGFGQRLLVKTPCQANLYLLLDVFVVISYLISFRLLHLVNSLQIFKRLEVLFVCFTSGPLIVYLSFVNKSFESV